MRRLLTAGIFGTILGIVGAGTANASIVSSGFLDEKLTEYALSTSLDLKANQSDFTELNTQITNSIDNLKSLWDADIGILADSFNPNKVNNDIEGAFGLVEGFIHYSMESLTRGWTSSGIGVRLENYYDYNPGLEGMFNGWTIYDPSGSETMVYKGLENISTQIRTIENTYNTGLARLLVNGENKINVEAYNYTGPIYPLWKLSEGIDKIGTLPSGITVEAMFNGWKDSNGNYFPGIFNLNKVATKLLNTYHPSDNTADILIQGAETTTIDGVDYTGPVYPLWKLSEGIDKIGTLPAGYDSVGAALTAIKGIAEDAKAAALAAIPDPKQEGSSGKFVLTVDIVGDNATYRWEKIDREGEATTTTE
ncbi:MAG: hypothetical protein IJN91_04790 [Alphaproteobacteria bacterium]|nr:hypothetical protein [Alphaproteobacteria bacterium]